jgi:ubiquitin C
MQIFVKTLSGKTIVLNAEPKQTIEEIKSIIEDIEGVPKDEQRLISHKELKNNKTLYDYNIKNLSTIYLSLCLKSSMQIIIKIISNIRNSITLNVDPNITTIKNIKKIIKNIKGYKVKNQRLIFQGKFLENEKKINDYNINNSSIIYLSLLNKNKFMEIVIKLKEGKKICIKVSPFGTILDIKEKIENMLGIETKNQILIFNNKILNNGEIISNYNIKEGNELFLLYFNLKEKTKMIP